MSDYKFDLLRQRVRELCPNLTEKQVAHACNKIANGMRRQDVYEVRLSRSPFGSQPGYFSDYSVEAGGQTIYVRLTVD